MVKVNPFLEPEEEDTGNYVLNDDAVCQMCKKLIYGMVCFHEGKMLCVFCHERVQREDDEKYKL